MSGDPITVLVADDEIDIRVLVRLVLESAGHGLQVVAEAVDGEDALALFDTLMPPPVPTIVILDNRMPRLTGLEVARHIRERLATQHIILFSAHLTPEIEAEARALGIDACVTKSDVRRLPTLIADLVGTASGDSQGQEHT